MPQLTPNRAYRLPVIIPLANNCKNNPTTRSSAF
jgi:hypothetical protein